MIEKIIMFFIRQRILAIILFFTIIIFGIYSYQKLPIDAFPDVSPVLVEIFTEAPGLAPEEVEKLISYPIEVAMNGLPDVTRIKSISDFSISTVSVYFKDNVDIYFARQLVLERLQMAKSQIPEGIGEPEMGPISTGMGQIYQYIVEGEGYDLMELRSIQDWIVKYQLQTIPGVTEILSHGGYVKQFQIKVNPDLLLKYDIPFCDLIEAVKLNNLNVGGSFIEKGSEEFIVRGLGWIKNIDDINNIKITTRNGIPIFIKNVAEAALGPTIRRGIATNNGKREIVTGNVLKLIGMNSSEVIKRVEEKVESINKNLPEGVKIIPYYEQASLVKKATGTIKNALFYGTILVILVLFLFLGNFRSSFIVVLALPISAFIAFIMMSYYNLSANLMSLGGLAIGIGMIVDATIVMVENIYRHLTEDKNKQSELIPSIISSAKEVARPVIFAILIIIIVFLPLFTLQGVEGKLFSPTAFTISFAMLGSLIFAIAIAPGICIYFFNLKMKSKRKVVIDFLKKIYIQILKRVVKHKKFLLVFSVLTLLVGLLLIPYLGTEFVPTLDEGSIMIRATMAPSISLTEAENIVRNLEKILLEFPEVKNVISKTGRDEIGACPEPISNSEMFIELAPENQWKTADNKENLIEKMNERLSQFPGVLLNFSQPIELRVDELLSGVKAQIAIYLYGDDLDILVDKAAEIQAVVSEVRGAADVQPEQVTGQPQIQIRMNRQNLARYGINVSEVQEIVSAAIGGNTIGEVFEGQQRYDIFVRFQEKFRKDVRAISNILVSATDGSRIPLSQLTDVKEIIGPKRISRENSQRRIVIQCNVRGRDMGGFVNEASELVDEHVKLPPGYYVEWGGQFENQKRAMRRLAFIVPLTIFMIFLMLYKSFDSIKNAILIVINLPFAMLGGILILFTTGLYLSVPAAIGFIALFGMSVENGIVMVSYFNQLRSEGKSINESIMKGAELRLRPVLMTAMTTALGLIPLLFSTGVGSEVQRPLAAVVVGGLFSSTLATLFILPALYGWFEKKEK